MGPASAATSDPTAPGADKSLYSYERGYSYTDPDGLYGDHSDFGHDLDGNCIGWQCDAE